MVDHKISWFHACLEGICSKWNTNRVIWDLNLSTYLRIIKSVLVEPSLNPGRRYRRFPSGQIKKSTLSPPHLYMISLLLLIKLERKLSHIHRKCTEFDPHAAPHQCFLVKHEKGKMHLFVNLSARCKLSLTPTTAPPIFRP